MAPPLLVTIIVIFINYISFCRSDWETCHAGHLRQRTIMELPCWGKCVTGNDIGCPSQYEELETELTSTHACRDNKMKRHLCQKNFRWRNHITRGEIDDKASCKNRRCNSGTLFVKDEYCRPADDKNCPPKVTTEGEKGICYKVDDNTNPGADITGYKIVSFCKTEIHFQYVNPDYKRMSLFK